MMSAPVASHSADMALIDEIRWARNAFEAILASSDDCNEQDGSDEKETKRKRG